MKRSRDMEITARKRQTALILKLKVLKMRLMKRAFLISAMTMKTEAFPLRMRTQWRMFHT